METGQVLDILRESLIVMIKIGAPILIVTLVVGLIISIFQAATQIQESTLAFLPKLIAIFVTLIFSFSYITNVLSKFSQELFSLMSQGIR